MKLAGSSDVYQPRFEQLVLRDAHDELPKPTREERQAPRLRLAKLAHNEWLDEGALTDAGEVVIDQRDLGTSPHASVPGEEAKLRRMASFKR